MNRRIVLLILASAAVILSASLFLLKNIKQPNIKPNEVKSNFSAAELFKQAQDLEVKGELIQAQGLYQGLINNAPNFDKIQEVEKKSGELNIKIVTSGIITPQAAVYEVQENDTLAKIAKKFSTTIELIKRSNMLNSDVIKTGQRLRIWTGKFSCVVDKSQNALILKSDNFIVKKYLAATGVNNSTPVGTFHIVNKLVNPVWYKTGVVVPAGSPENILGTRWMGFDLEGYGIHGTTDPVSIGTQATQGCVRLTNPEVEELYMLLPVGTEVIVVD